MQDAVSGQARAHGGKPSDDVARVAYCRDPLRLDSARFSLHGKPPQCVLHASHSQRNKAGLGMGYCYGVGSVWA
jgi:hypothetical protein